MLPSCIGAGRSPLPKVASSWRARVSCWRTGRPPAWFSSDESPQMTSTLVGGQRLWLRLLEPTDANLIRLFFLRLSSETVYRRFLAPIKAPANALLEGLVDIDHCDREAL